MAAASYGTICDSFAYTYFDEYESMHYVTVIRAGSAEDWYEVFGLQSNRKKAGDFSVYRTYRVTNGEVTLSEPKKITGRLYEYDGFVHSICEISDMIDISPDDPFPLTFVPNREEDTEEQTK